jgi:hypothetical protein
MFSFGRLGCKPHQVRAAASCGGRRRAAREAVVLWPSHSLTHSSPALPPALLSRHQHLALLPKAPRASPDIKRGAYAPVLHQGVEPCSFAVMLCSSTIDVEQISSNSRLRGEYTNRYTSEDA